MLYWACRSSYWVYSYVRPTSGRPRPDRAAWTRHFGPPKRCSLSWLNLPIVRAEIATIESDPNHYWRQPNDGCDDDDRDCGRWDDDDDGGDGDCCGAGDANGYGDERDYDGFGVGSSVVVVGVAGADAVDAGVVVDVAALGVGATGASGRSSNQSLVDDQSPVGATFATASPS